MKQVLIKNPVWGKQNDLFQQADVKHIVMHIYVMFFFLFKCWILFSHAEILIINRSKREKREKLLPLPFNA